MNTMKKWILLGVLIVATVTGVVVASHLSGSVWGDEVEVDWRLLGELDFVTGQASSELKALDGQGVKIPGFMVPLEDEQKMVTEFLLVPSAQACIHVPPPPPNQMVHVKMKQGTEVLFGPIWIYGKLKLTTTRSIYGESSFEIEGVHVEPYQ